MSPSLPTPVSGHLTSLSSLPTLKIFPHPSFSSPHVIISPHSQHLSPPQLFITSRPGVIPPHDRTVPAIVSLRHGRHCLGTVSARRHRSLDGAPNEMEYAGRQGQLTAPGSVCGFIWELNTDTVTHGTQENRAHYRCVPTRTVRSWRVIDWWRLGTDRQGSWDGANEG